MPVVFPPWESVTPKQRAAISNGVGPAFLPSWMRRVLTSASLVFFDEASWEHHDYGYLRGGREKDRRRCDWLFFKAMLRDAQNTDKLWKRPVGVGLSVVFYLTVSMFGWLQFYYGGHEKLPGALLDE